MLVAKRPLCRLSFAINFPSEPSPAAIREVMFATSDKARLAWAMVDANSICAKESLTSEKFSMTFVKSPLLAFRVLVSDLTLDMTLPKLYRFSATVLSKLAAVFSSDCTLRSTLASAAGS